MLKIKPNEIVCFALAMTNGYGYYVTKEEYVGKTYKRIVPAYIYGIIITKDGLCHKGLLDRGGTQGYVILHEEGDEDTGAYNFLPIHRLEKSIAASIEIDGMTRSEAIAKHKELFQKHSYIIQDKEVQKLFQSN